MAFSLYFGGLNLQERNGGLNLVLLGKIGAGKSASGNTILGREAFESKESFTSVTQDVAVESGWVCGRRVTVYDTPGLFNTKLSEQEIQKIYVNVLQKCESGRCVFLLVIKADRFTGKERETVEKIEELLGEERLKKTWILFTGRDELEEENMTIKEFINLSEPLKRLVQKYDQRYHVFNNKPNGQVQELLTKIYSTYPDRIEKGAIQIIPPHPIFTVRRMRMSEMMSCEGSLRIVGRLSVSDDASRRIVLLGQTGAGKSAAGNTILGQREFNSVMSTSSVTSVCSEAHATVYGRSVSVVDTPGLYNTEMRPVESMTEIMRSVYLSSPGPHTFLIVFRVDVRFTEQEQQIPQRIKTLFGQEVLKYSIILFTHGDLLRGESVEKVIQENSRLRDLVGQCGGRFHVFNNRDVNNRDQVNDLLQKIDTMIEQNGGGHYSHQMFEDAQRLRREEEERKQQEEIERVRKETEERVRAEFEGPPRFLQERLKAVRLSEEDRKRQYEIERERRQNRGLMGFIILELGFHSIRTMAMISRHEEQRREEIERVIKETEWRIRAEFEGPPRLLLERFKAMRLREEAEKTQREDKQRQEEIERVRKETEKRVRAEFEGPPRFLKERLKAMRLSVEERIQEEVERQEEFERFLFSLRRIEIHMEMSRMEMQSKLQEEIERVIKEMEENIRAKFKCPPR